MFGSSIFAVNDFMIVLYLCLPVAESIFAVNNFMILCMPVAESVFAVNDFMIVLYLRIPIAESVFAVNDFMIAFHLCSRSGIYYCCAKDIS